MLYSITEVEQGNVHEVVSATDRETDWLYKKCVRNKRRETEYENMKSGDETRKQG